MTATPEEVIRDAVDAGIAGGIRSTITNARCVVDACRGNPAEALDALDELFTLTLAELDLKETP